MQLEFDVVITVLLILAAVFLAPAFFFVSYFALYFLFFVFLFVALLAALILAIYFWQISIGIFIALAASLVLFGLLGWIVRRNNQINLPFIRITPLRLIQLTIIVPLSAFIFISNFYIFFAEIALKKLVWTEAHTAGLVMTSIFSYFAIHSVREAMKEFRDITRGK